MRAPAAALGVAALAVFCVLAIGPAADATITPCDFTLLLEDLRLPEVGTTTPIAAI